MCTCLVQIEVKFDIDANGILSVSATDKGSGRQTDIKITGASTLSSDEVSLPGVDCPLLNPEVRDLMIVSSSECSHSIEKVRR